MLRTRVTSVRSVHDCSALFAELGYQPTDTPFDAGWTIVARWQRFPVIAADAAAPREVARTMARSLSGSARTGLVVAIQSGQELVLATPRVGHVGCSRILTISTSSPGHFALQQLEALRPRHESNSLTHALRVLDVLESEEVGERFFTAFRTIHLRMSAFLNDRGTADERSLMALLTLTRVLFLYFVQAKGWLDGRADYLKQLLDTALSRRQPFHRDVLHPLFFGTLNRAPAERETHAGLGAVPYLNGGLFEPHPVERRLGHALFPNRLWRDAFDDLFEHYKFCVREDDEVGAIAPDMLGRVFERIMSAEERHATGTYYTPESVVRDLVRATVATALTSDDIGQDVAHRVVRAQPIPTALARVVRHALAHLTVLDPAVGSGAFLLGALECLTEAHVALQRRVSPRTRWKLRRRILQQNLFGVDISPVAVRLAELRLWLAVVADDPTADPTRVTPLPNLDGIVRQGDSLLDPVGAVRALGVITRKPAAARDVDSARAHLFNARGAHRTAAEHDLRNAEHRLAHEALAMAQAQTRQALRELAALARGRDLFGHRTGFTEPQRRRHRALKRRVAELREMARRVATGEVPFFSFEVHRPDVIARGGFSAVLGNPPWVRAERLPEAKRQALKDRFGWWRSGPTRGFGHLPDLSVAFLERALELVAPDGAVGLLVPSKITSAGYGGAARSALVRETTIAYLQRIPDRAAARFQATTYPLAIVVKNRKPQPTHAVALDFSGTRSVRQHSLAASGPWILLPARAQRAIARFLESGIPLSGLARPALGVKTGADAIFVGKVAREGRRASTLQVDDGEFEIETDLLRASIRGRDVRPFSIAPTRSIIWALDAAGEPHKALPPLAARYFRERRQRLDSRADHAGGPPWTLFRVRTASAGWRVVWPDIARRPTAAVLDPENRAVPLNTCYVVCVPDREAAVTVAATLNSTWAHALVRALADEARGGYRRHNAAVIGRMPVPLPGRARRAVVRLGTRAQETGHVDQDALDREVARALALPPRTCADLAALARDSG